VHVGRLRKAINLCRNTICTVRSAGHGKRFAATTWPRRRPGHDDLNVSGPASL
jgi:hypothetical protein